MPERIPLTRDDAERGVLPVPFTAAEWEALHRASATYASLPRDWRPGACGGRGPIGVPGPAPFAPDPSPPPQAAP